MNRKRVIAFAMAAAMTLSLTACGGSGTTTTTKAGGDAGTTAAGGAETTAASGGSEEQITLTMTWWGNTVRNEVTQAAAAAYHELHPNITIQCDFTDWSGYWTKLATTTAGGNMPDIVQMDYAQMNNYQDNLYDLSGFVSDGTIDTSKINSQIIDSGKIGNKLLAISLGSNAPCFAYDKAVTDEAGVTISEQPTLEEILEAGEKIYAATGKQTYFDGGYTMGMVLARTQKSCMFDEWAEGKTDSTKLLFDWVEKFNNAEGAVSAATLIEKDPSSLETTPIVDGTTWNNFCFSNQYMTLEKNCGRDITMVMYPTTKDAQQNPEYLKPSQFFSVAATSKYPEEAAKFIDWFTNDVDANIILQGERGVPINDDVAAALKAEAEKNGDTVTAEIYDFVAAVGKIANPIDAPDPTGGSTATDQMATVIENIRNGVLTVDDALAEYIPFAQNALKTAK